MTGLVTGDENEIVFVMGDVFCPANAMMSVLPAEPGPFSTRLDW